MRRCRNACRHWYSPSDINNHGTSTFDDSHDGVAGGYFAFFFTILPGDFNRDNVVDAIDYTIWRDNEDEVFGATDTSTGDADGNGDVDAFDRAFWLLNYGLDFSSWS